MAKNEYATNVVADFDSCRPPRPRDAILDHFDQDMRTALDRADYNELARLARCAAAYQRSLGRW